MSTVFSILQVYLSKLNTTFIYLSRNDIEMHFTKGFFLRIGLGIRNMYIFIEFHYPLRSTKILFLIRVLWHLVEHFTKSLEREWSVCHHICDLPYISNMETPDVHKRTHASCIKGLLSVWKYISYDFCNVTLLGLVFLIPWQRSEDRYGKQWLLRIIWPQRKPGHLFSSAWCYKRHCISWRKKELLQL